VFIGKIQSKVIGNETVFRAIYFIDIYPFRILSVLEEVTGYMKGNTISIEISCVRQ
jgi:hypothetical protein